MRSTGVKFWACALQGPLEPRRLNSPNPAVAIHTLWVPTDQG